MAKSRKTYSTYEEYWQAVEEASFKKNCPSLNNGNHKTGRACLTLSMPYRLSCRPDAPCLGICYCRKGPQAFPSVCGAYLRNFRLWQEDPVKFENQVDAALTYNALPLLRFFDAGDAPDKEFVEMMFRLAEKHSEIKMMAFTKKYELFNEVLDEKELPENLCIRFSMWDRHWNVPNPHNLPVSFVDFADSSNNPDIPKNAFTCRGGKDGVTCSNCQMCFNKKVKAVRLIEH